MDKSGIEIFPELNEFYLKNSTENFYLASGKTWNFMQNITNCSLKVELDTVSP